MVCSLVTTPLSLTNLICRRLLSILTYSSFALLMACGGTSPQTQKLKTSSPINLMEIPSELGSTVQLQLWVARTRLSGAPLRNAEQCTPGGLAFTLLERPEAVGLVVSGFPGEIGKSLKALVDTPRCLESYLNASQPISDSTVVDRLAQHLTASKFRLGVIMASQDSIRSLKPTLALLIADQRKQTHSDAPSTTLVQSRLKTYQTAGEGLVKLGFPLQLSTPEALADMELAVRAIRNSADTKNWESVELLPTSQTGRFILELVQNTPTEKVKATLADLIRDLCFEHDQWSNPRSFMAARHVIKSELTYEMDEPSAHVERMARTRLSFGSQANERWQKQVVQVGHYDWLKSVRSQLQPQSVMIEVGVSKGIIGTPDFELAFFEEVLAEELRHIDERQAPSVASTRTDILIFHKRPQNHQSLRIAVGLPESSRTSLTSAIQQNIKECIHSYS